jgi:hypothetical protein
MFEKKMKNLPVVHKNRLVGLVNLQDICLFQPEILKLLEKNMETPKNIQKGFEVLYNIETNAHPKGSSVWFSTEMDELGVPDRFIEHFSRQSAAQYGLQFDCYTLHR